jgi:hypothetical protein
MAIYLTLYIIKLSMEGGKEMWRFKYVICLVSRHIWIGSLYRYCLRCGKLEIEHAHDIVP